MATFLTIVSVILFVIGIIILIEIALFYSSYIFYQYKIHVFEEYKAFIYKCMRLSAAKGQFQVIYLLGDSSEYHECRRNYGLGESMDLCGVFNCFWSDINGVVEFLSLMPRTLKLSDGVYLSRSLDPRALSDAEYNEFIGHKGIPSWIKPFQKYILRAQKIFKKHSFFRYSAIREHQLTNWEKRKVRFNIFLDCFIWSFKQFGVILHQKIKRNKKHNNT